MVVKGKRGIKYFFLLPSAGMPVKKKTLHEDHLLFCEILHSSDTINQLATSQYYIFSYNVSTFLV